MERLAEDTLRFIFLQLPPITILALSMCCRRFNQIVTNSFEIQIILRRHLYNRPQAAIENSVSGSDKLKIIKYNEVHLTQLLPTALTTYPFPTFSPRTGQHGLEVFLVSHVHDIIISIPTRRMGEPGKWLLCHVFHKGQDRWIHTTFEPYGAAFSNHHQGHSPYNNYPNPKACPYISVEDDVIVIRQGGQWGQPDKTHIFHLFGDGDMAKPHTNPPLDGDHSHINITCPKTFDQLLDADCKIPIDDRGALIYHVARDLPFMQFPVPPEDWPGTLDLEWIPSSAGQVRTFWLLLICAHWTLYDAQKAFRERLPFTETKAVMMLNLPFPHDIDIITNSIEDKGLLVVRQQWDAFFVILPYTSLAILYNALKGDKHNISGMKCEDGVPVWEMCQWSHLSVNIDCLAKDRDFSASEQRRNVKASGLRLVDSLLTKEGNIIVKLYDFNTRLMKCHDVNRVLGGLSDILEVEPIFTTSTPDFACRRTRYLKTVHPAAEKSIAYTEYEAEFEPILDQEAESLVGEYVIQELFDGENLLIVVTGGRIFNFRFSLLRDFATVPSELEV